MVYFGALKKRVYFLRTEIKRKSTNRKSYARSTDFQ